MVGPTDWIKTHAAVSIAVGAVLVLGGGGAAAAVVASSVAPPNAVAADSPSATPSVTDSPSSSAPSEASTAAPSGQAAGQAATQPNGGGAPADPATDSDPAPTEQPPADPPPAPPAVPSAPTGVSLQANGSGGFTVSWNPADMNGLAVDHYWVDVTDSGGTHGDRISPIHSTSVTTTEINADTNCVFVGVVATNGAQSGTAGPVCN